MYISPQVADQKCLIPHPGLSLSRKISYFPGEPFLLIANRTITVNIWLDISQW